MYVQTLIDHPSMLVRDTLNKDTNRRAVLLVIIVMHRQYFCTNTCRRALRPLFNALLSREMSREQRKLVL